MKIQYYMIFGMFLLLCSCSDEGEIPMYGCMDEISDNYDSNATVDDGSCEYDCNLGLTGCEECSPTYPTFTYDDIYNIFDVSNCLGCHTGTSSGGLDLSTYEGLMDGGNNGSIITECNPWESLLITTFDEDGLMCNNQGICDFYYNGQTQSNNLWMIQTWIWEGCPE